MQAPLAARPRLPVPRIGLALVAVVALTVACAVLVPGTGEYRRWEPRTIASIACLIVALLIVAALAVRRARQEPDLRWAWHLVAAGAVVTAIRMGGTWYGMHGGELHLLVTDWAGIALYPLLVGAIALISHAAIERGALRLWLDFAAVTLALSALAALCLIEPIVRGTPFHGPDFWINIVRAGGMLVVVAAATSALAMGTLPRTAPWFLLIGCTLSNIAGVLVGAWRAGHHHTLTYSTASMMLAATAVVGWAVVTGSDRSTADERPSGWHTATPVAACAAALVVLTVSVVGRDIAVAPALLALGTIAVALLRMLLTLRENVRLQHARHEAITDELTGLGNRRRLRRDLEECIRSARPATLALLDLDGFKGYNDLFGHEAGDDLLRQLAALLQRAVPQGRLYRPGGDEFCLLLHGHVDATAIAKVAATFESCRTSYRIGASYGAVQLPDEAASADAALRIADDRLYELKETRRIGPRSQARQLLLQIVAEQQPHLREHVGAVGALADEVGRSLGLTEEECEHLATCAALHDIGKVAIPRAILDKQGPLDPDEWAFMRRHPEIGERIVAAAPALRPVARLVRHHHERWDGAGYPDRLAGDAIPLGSRIIAVCDAWQAMLEDRPYRTAVGEAAARAELERCAGAQFDPRVVAAFLRALDERAPLRSSG